METLFLSHLYSGDGLPVARQVKFTLSNSWSSDVLVGCVVILTSVPLHSAEIRTLIKANDDGRFVWPMMQLPLSCTLIQQSDSDGLRFNN